MTIAMTHAERKAWKLAVIARDLARVGYGQDVAEGLVANADKYSHLFKGGFAAALEAFRFPAGRN